MRSTQYSLRCMVIVLFFLYILSVCLSAPSPIEFPGKENNFSCYHIQCPKSTVACKRLQTTSKDGSKLVTEVECQDEQGTAIDTVRKEEPNPFDRATKFSSYSFTGHYEGSLSRPINVHNNHYFNNNDDSDVEIFK